MVFLLLLLVWPFAEITLFVQVGGAIGYGYTLLLLIFSAVLGSFLAQWQGLTTTLSLRKALDTGKVPVQEVFDTFCIFIAGILLILPGFISDIAAFLLLLPPFRMVLREWLSGYVGVRHPRHENDNVIEGEFTRMDDSDKHLLD